MIIVDEIERVGTHSVKELINDLNEGFICNTNWDVLNNDAVSKEIRDKLNELLPDTLLKAAEKGLVCCVVGVIDSKHAPKEIKQKAQSLVECAVNNACDGDPRSTLIGTNGLQDFIKRKDISQELREKAETEIKRVKLWQERELASERRVKLLNAEWCIKDVLESQLWKLEHLTMRYVLDSINIFEQEEKERVVALLFQKIMGGDHSISKSGLNLLRLEFLRFAIESKYTSFVDRLIDLISISTYHQVEANFFVRLMEEKFGIAKLSELSKQRSLGIKIGDRIRIRLAEIGTGETVENKSFTSRPVPSGGGQAPNMARRMFR